MDKGSKKPKMAAYDEEKSQSYIDSRRIIEDMRSLKEDILRRMDKQNLSSQLEEELEIRKQIQEESKRLLAEIKISHEQQLSQLTEEMQVKEELEVHKQMLIDELNLLVKELRAEIKRLNEELQNARSKEGDVQKRLSQSYRGSISMIESQLHQKSSELENRVKEMEDKHVEEMNNKIKEYEELIDELKLSLNEKNDELEEVKGRLEESRQAREETLGDLKSSRKKYVESIQELEKKFEEAQDQLDLLQNNKSQDTGYSNQIEELESQLNETVKINHDMEERLDLIKKENSNKQLRIDELDRIIDRLQVSMKDIAKQKEELQDATGEYIRMTQLNQTVNSAQKLLQDQLERCQLDFESTKVCLMEERHLNKELRQNLDNVLKDLGLAKVDIRFFTRENRLLEEKIKKDKEESSKATTEMENFREINMTLEKRIVELEKEVSALKLKCEGDTYDLNQVQQMYDEVKVENQKLETKVTELKCEKIQLEAQLQQDQELKTRLSDQEILLNEKNQQLEEQNRKIENLQMNLVLLREASTILDNQLTDFEDLVTRKSKELENAETAKTQLQEECSLLKDQVKKVRIEINEAKSLKTFVEKRLNEVEGDLKDQGFRTNEKVSSLVTKVDALKLQNHELVLTVNSLTADLELLAEEKGQLELLMGKVEKDNAKLTEEIARTYNSLIDLKDQNITLKSGLEENIQKAESYKSLCEILTKDHEAVDVDRYEREVQLQSTVNQQLKLIEHLQTQNEALNNKKKGGIISNWFGKPKEDSEITPKSSKYPTSQGSNRPATIPELKFLQHKNIPAVTPIRIVQNEHRAVQGLEEKAASLKHQLALLQDIKEVKTQNDPILPEPRKEECILLHKKPELLLNIPPTIHQFKEKVVMKAEKCWGCMEPIYFSRVSCVCSNCSAIFHVQCAGSAVESCGLPKEAVIKLEMSKCPGKNTLTEDDDDEFVENSVYVAGEKDWERHRVRIQNGKFLMYGDAPSNSQPLRKFPLNGKTRVELRVVKSDVPVAIPKDKLPFILKVVTPPEVGLRSWDDNKCIFIMTDDNDQKRFWTRAIFKNSTYKGSSTTIDSDDLLLDINRGTSISGIRKVVVFRDTDNRLDINCTFFVSNDLYLLGCENGLYSRRVISSQPSNKVKIDGVDAVYQIEIIPSLNSVVMIEGEDRHLILVHMGVLRVCAEAAECSKPKLTVESVGDIKHCHLIQVQEGAKGEVYLAAATPKHLYVLAWDGDQFVGKKRINTKETVTCMHMTRNSVIFGSDRVYELDIKNFQLEEFIDDSEDSLYYIRFACDMFASFPVAILDVGMSNWNPSKATYTPEYLLCFPDMAVFVDAYGRRTRGEDIVWTKLPLAISYRHPNLFVLHFSSIELIRLEAGSYTRTRVIEAKNLPRNVVGQNGHDSIGQDMICVPDSRFVNVTSPRFLGSGGKTASIIVSSLENNKTEMFELDLEWGTSL